MTLFCVTLSKLEKLHFRLIEFHWGTRPSILKLVFFFPFPFYFKPIPSCSRFHRERVKLLSIKRTPHCFLIIAQLSRWYTRHLRNFWLPIPRSLYARIIRGKKKHRRSIVSSFPCLIRSWSTFKSEHVTIQRLSFFPSTDLTYLEIKYLRWSKESE